MIRKSQTLWLLAILSVAGGGRAQSCPPTDGSGFDAAQPSVLHGTIQFHDGVRPWLGLALDRPACGAKEIEIVFTDEGWREAKRMRGCTATVRGKISESPTIYYATDLNVSNPSIVADGGCHLLPPDPDYASFRISDDVRSYRLTVFIDVKGDKPLRAEVMRTDGIRQSLTPWQPYADMFLNGEEDLSLGCANGFGLLSWKSSDPKYVQQLDSNIALTSSSLGPAWLTIECRRE
ncbi:MAG: hypothetical protein WCC14_02440 [Acidobacteriaceae bacterium]